MSGGGARHGDKSACDDFVRECKFVPICAYSLTKLCEQWRLRALEPAMAGARRDGGGAAAGRAHRRRPAAKASARESARGLRRVLGELCAVVGGIPRLEGARAAVVTGDTIFM